MLIKRTLVAMFLIYGVSRLLWAVTANGVSLNNGKTIIGGKTSVGTAVVIKTSTFTVTTGQCMGLLCSVTYPQ